MLGIRNVNVPFQVNLIQTIAMMMMQDEYYLGNEMFCDSLSKMVSVSSIIPRAPSDWNQWEGSFWNQKHHWFYQEVG